MSRILRQHSFVADDWVTLVDPPGDTPPGDAESVIVPFAKFRESRETWLAHKGRLGVLLAPGAAFGDGYDTFARLCFTGVPPERVVRGIERLRDALDAYVSG